MTILAAGAKTRVSSFSSTIRARPSQTRFYSEPTAEFSQISNRLKTTIQSPPKPLLPPHLLPSKPKPPPKGSFLDRKAIYPLVLFSVMLSISVNLGRVRRAGEGEAGHYSAQVSVLESLIERLKQERARGKTSLSAKEQEEIEKELELVGLGRGKGRTAVKVVGSEEEVKYETTSLKEVFFGKKGKEYEQEDTTDWEKVFNDADAAEQRKSDQHIDRPPTPLPPAPVLRELVEARKIQKKPNETQPPARTQPTFFI